MPAFWLLWAPQILRKELAFKPFAIQWGLPCRCKWRWIEQVYTLGMAENLKKLLYGIARGLQVSVA
jgi:hypothetical protein